jgi:hypothetical protein
LGHLLSLLILIFAISLPVRAEKTYESEREALYERALLDRGFDSESLIGSLFDSNSLEFDMCDMMDETIEGDELECDLEPAFEIEGISSKGRDILISASKAYESYQLDLLDEETRRFVALCETGVNDPSAIASEKGDIWHAIFELKLQYYERVISELVESDVLTLEKYSSELWGMARPGTSDARRKIEKKLAERFPQDYRQAHLQQCITAIENKGLPFKRFRREPSREDCEKITHSFGAKGEKITSSVFSGAEGCWTVEYYAQKPEMPGDQEIKYK